MKLPALAVTVCAAAALVAGSVAAQASNPPATMQPIPNPPESGKAMHGKMHGHHMHHHMHKHMHVHHHMKKSDMDKGSSDTTAAPAPSTPPAPK